MRAPRRLSAALQFRAEIETAEAAGASRDDLSLHLTLGDVAELKRDRTLPVTDISFAGGTMRFLGVKIVEGGVSASVLQNIGAPAHG